MFVSGQSVLDNAPSRHLDAGWVFTTIKVFN
jgi:hypothetical protein